MFQNEKEIVEELNSTLKAEQAEAGEFIAFSALDGDDYGRGELEALKTEVARLSYLVTAMSVKLIKAGAMDSKQLAKVLYKVQFITRS